MTELNSKAIFLKGMSFIILLFLASLSACTNGSDSDDSDSSSDELSTDACSVLNLSNRIHARIVNGTACGELERSPVVRIVLTNESGRNAFCSGTMITTGTVLTAAHCFLSNPSQVLVLAGRSVDSAIEFRASSWLIHPDFEAQSDRAINDVAIIRLINNTNLPTVPVMTETGVRASEIVSIFGYGKDENDNFNFDELRSGEMRVDDITRNHVIAKFDGRGSNTCQGDSGGPLLSSRTGQAAIAGVTSSGLAVNCLEGDTSFFTNMASSSVEEFLRNNVPGANYL